MTTSNKEIKEPSVFGFYICDYILSDNNEFMYIHPSFKFNQPSYLIQSDKEQIQCINLQINVTSGQAFIDNIHVRDIKKFTRNSIIIILDSLGNSLIGIIGNQGTKVPQDFENHEITDFVGKLNDFRDLLFARFRKKLLEGKIGWNNEKLLAFRQLHNKLQDNVEDLFSLINVHIDEHKVNVGRINEKIIDICLYLIFIHNRLE